MGSKTLREQRAKLWDDNKKLLDKAEAEGRDFTVEEQAEWEKRDKELDNLKNRIERMERAEVVTAEMLARADLPIAPKAERHNPALSTPSEAVDIEIRRSNAFRAWALHGTHECTDEFRQAAVDCGFDPSRKEINIRLDRRPCRTVRDATERLEKRAQSVGTTTAGGFTVPDEMMRTIEVALLLFGGMRQASNIIRTSSGADLPIPTVNDTAQVGAILAENTAVSNQDVTFGQLVLQAYKYSSKQVLVSVELMQDSSVNLEALLGRLLGERLGRIQNTHFTTGTGTGQPNGIVTASTLGVTGGAGVGGAFTADNLIDLFHSVDPAYRGPGSGWMMRDASVATLRKLKDTTNQYIWQPGLQAGDPDLLLGRPIFVNQDVAAVALSAKSVIFGQLNLYQIRDVLDVVLLRLNERYADAHQVAFLAFMRTDGDLLNAGTNPVKHFIGNAA